MYMNCSSQKESHAHLKKSRSLLVHSDCEALESCRLRVKLPWTTCSPLNSHLLPNSATITSFYHLKPLGCIKWPHLKNATSKPLTPIAEFPHFSVTQLMFPFMYLENALIKVFFSSVTLKTWWNSSYTGACGIWGNRTNIPRPWPLIFGSRVKSEALSTFW